MKQCSVQLDGTTDNISKIPIMLNIIKYCTAFPPIWLAAAAGLGYSHPYLAYVTTLAATINSIYSFLWDVIMDWGLMTVYRSGKCLFRSRWLVPSPFHFIACFINLFLRFMWAANRIPVLEKLHPTHLVLLVELAEVSRRAMWNIFRVEWEVIVQHDRASVKSREVLDNEPDTSTSSTSLLSMMK